VHRGSYRFGCAYGTTISLVHETVMREPGALRLAAGLAHLMVHVPRPLFVLDPMVMPAGELVILTALALAVALACALAATVLLRRLSPTDILREA
jgi:hypothetical protein